MSLLNLEFETHIHTQTLSLAKLTFFFSDTQLTEVLGVGKCFLQ